MPNNKIPPFILQTIEPVADFNPGRDEACYCGSGKTFYQCCGSAELVRPPPVGLFMFENYIDASLARDLTAFAEQHGGQRLMVLDNAQSSADNIVKVEDKNRIAERVNMGDRFEELNAMVKSAFVDLTQKCIGQPLQWYETPDLMRYHEGGFYIKHADSQNMDTETRTWSKIIDRDLSMVIYLNDDFEGGELSFYKLNYQVRPRAGAAVLFPSDHRFLHAAEKVTKGVRYAVVSWGSLRGIKKVAKNPPDSAIFLD